MSKILFELDSDKLLSDILVGVEAASLLIGKTMGPNGHLVALQGKFSKDGATVASGMHMLSSASQEIGRKCVVNLSSEVGQYGDGSTTAAVFLNSLLKAAYRVLKSGVSLYDLKKSLKLFESLSNIIIESIKINVDSDSPLLTKIIGVSVNHDYKLAELIAQPYRILGKHARVVIEESKKTEDYLEIKPGCSVPSGVISSAFFVTPQEQQKNTIEMDNACILVTDAKLEYSENLMRLLSEIKDKGKSLLIIAGDISNFLMSILLANKVIFNAVAIKAPGFGDRKIDNLRDVGILTGAEPLLTQMFPEITEIEYSQLGFAKKVIVKSNETIIIEGGGNKDALDTRIKEIENRLLNAATQWEKEKCEERLGSLRRGIATISIGGFNQASIDEKRDRCTDGCQTASHVVTHGAIPGAGSEGLYVKFRLKHILHEYSSRGHNVFTDKESNLIHRSENEQNGITNYTDILKDLDVSLYRQIVFSLSNSLDVIFDTITSNADIPDSQVIKHNIIKEFERGNIYSGYNILSKELVNLADIGILSPFYGFKTTVSKTTELTSILISTGGAVYDKTLETNPESALY